MPRHLSCSVPTALVLLAILTSPLALAASESDATTTTTDDSVVPVPEPLDQLQTVQASPPTRRSDHNEPPRVSSVCVYNKAGFVLKWKLRDPEADASSSTTRAYPILQTKCMNAGSAIPNTTNGTVLYPVVKAIWGRQIQVSKPVIFDADIARQVTYVCTGTTLRFRCEQKPAPPTAGEIAEQLGKWIVGFTEGLGTELSISACMHEIVATGHLIDTMVDFFEAGINGRVVTAIKLGIEMIIQVVTKIADAIRVCAQDALAIASKFVALAARVAGNVGAIVEVVMDGAVRIFRQGREITQNLKGIVTSWRAGDFKGSGEDAGTVVGIFLGTIQDL